MRAELGRVRFATAFPGIWPEWVSRVAAQAGRLMALSKKDV